MKKGQATPYVSSNVAVFILLLGLFLAIYVLLLPPEDREALLYDETEDNSNQKESSNIILNQFVGTLKPAENDEIIHKIDSINLYSKEEPKITDLAYSLHLEKSLTSETKRNLVFNINNLESLENANLILVASKNKGNLIVSLNNVIIYDSKVSGLANIVLPKEILQMTNYIELSVSSPGLNIFGKNSYDLSNIKLRENYQLTNTRESRDFTISRQETGNAELRFVLYCNINRQGSRLNIYLNNKEIKNEIISCMSAERKMDIKNDDLEKGSNTLMFQIDKGDYIFNDIKLDVKTNFKGVVNYKFAITEDEFDDILSEDKELRLSIEFNNDESKKATLSVNGKEFSLDTTDIDYERDISRLIKEGNNFVKITPSNEFSIDLLKLTLK